MPRTANPAGLLSQLAIWDAIEAISDGDAIIANRLACSPLSAFWEPREGLSASARF